ncbi:MAG: hypothetical protein K5778_10175 [Bacteroidaceae bacterium]|nr:hypothetical protein [Bacteroidaceae bacterium]
MKTLRNILAVTLLLFTVSVQFASAQSMESFFRYNNNQAYKVILYLAHPGNTFTSGSVEVDGNYVKVKIFSEDDNYTNIKLIVRLHKQGIGFDSIELISDNDDYPAWLRWTVRKLIIDGILLDVFDDPSSESMTKLRNYYNENIKDMGPKKMTCAALTYLLWRY